MVNHSMSDNFFILLNIPQEFEIDFERLEKNYVKLQQLFHPDKQVNKTKAEKLFALELAAKINKAYGVLKDDKKRAEYLLSLHGIIINQEEGNNIDPDKSMLLEILEISEDPLGYDIAKMKEKCWENFKLEFAKGSYKEAAQAIIKLQYLNKYE